MKHKSFFLMLILFCSTGAAHASTWTIQDNYIGGTILNRTVNNGWAQNNGDVIALSDEIDYFDIDNMIIAITPDGDVTVEIQTDYMNSHLGTTYGDLFISTAGWQPYGDANTGYAEDRFGLGQTWNYVLVTPSSSSIFGNIYEVNQNNIQTSNQVMTAPIYHYRNNQEVLYNPGDEEASQGAFSFTTSQSLISYAFNLSSLGGLNWEDELDLGFHWTMTCANDVIQGGIYKAAVPEPGTMLLLGMGIAGLGAAGRKRRARRKEISGNTF